MASTWCYIWFLQSFFVRRQTFSALKKQKIIQKKLKVIHKKTENKTAACFFCKILVIVYVGFAMKCSCRLCWALCHPNEQDFCTRAPGSCLTGSFDQTLPTRSPHPRGNISLWRQTGGKHDVSVWVAAKRVAARSAWMHEPVHSEEESKGGRRSWGSGACGSRWFVWTFGLTSHYSKRM